MPGWPVRVFISTHGHAYHDSPFCQSRRAGQEKAREGGHLVRKIICVPLVQVRDRREHAGDV